MTELKAILRQLCSEANKSDADRVVAPFRLSATSRAIGDSRLQKYIEALPSYGRALDTFTADNTLIQQYGHDHVRFALQQFVVNFLAVESGDPAVAFAQVWGTFEREIAEPARVFMVVSNLQNFECPEESLELLPGITIRTRSYDALAKLFHWPAERIDQTLGRDWSFAGGSHVLVVENRQPKSTENVVLGNDAVAVDRFYRTLVALRALRSGFLRTGVLFYVNPEWFSMRLGGIASAGNASSWQPGTPYVLTTADVSAFRDLFATIERVEKLQEKVVRPLHLALRAFSSIYSRDFNRADERLVNAVTTIEALLRIDFELSFRSAFRVAGILASTDDERVAIFEAMQSYYDTRSKIVHGGTLKTKHEKDLQNEEPLLDWTRMLLRGFLTLADAGLIDGTLYDTFDATLQHAQQRHELRRKMKLA